MKKRSIIDKWVYKHSQKPTHYAEIRNPPRTMREKRQNVQKARQEQYNRWSKHFKIYSGSYLPKDDKKLLKQGWLDETKSHNIKGGGTLYRRKSTNQWVRNDHDQTPWHWYNWWGKILGTKHFRKNKYATAYLDKYGNICGKRDKSHHIESAEE